MCSVYIRSNKTDLNNVVFAESTRTSIRFPKILNSLSELDYSTYFWS